MFRCLVNNIGSLGNGCAAEVARGAYTGLTFWSFVSESFQVSVRTVMYGRTGLTCWSFVSGSLPCHAFAWLLLMWLLYCVMRAHRPPLVVSCEYNSILCCGPAAYFAVAH